MRKEHVKYLCCPKTKRPLVLKNEKYQEGLVKEGVLFEKDTGCEYPIIDFIPRFVPKENYAESFGYQWNIHKHTQFDEISGHSVSRDRFWTETKFEKDLSGQLILEVGCGAGRFTRHAADAGATVVSVDFSNAVEANYKNNGNLINALIVQADVYQLPFPVDFFDKAFAFGVLQHTPDPRRAFFCIVDHLKSEGRVVSDIYVKNLKRWALGTKYYVRPFTHRMEPQKLYHWVVKYIDFMWPLSRLIRKTPRIGPTINWKLLIADHSEKLPEADDKVLKQWAYLDTMDMLSPKYDYPQTLRRFKKWHKEAGLRNIVVCYGYNGLEGRGVKT